MPSVYAPHWRSAPGYPVAVDAANPLARGLISAYLLSAGEYNVDNDGSLYGRKNGRRSSAVTGKPYTLHGYFVSGASEAPLVYANGGVALNFNGTANTVAASSSHPKALTTPVTIITKVFLRSTSSPQVLAGYFNGGLSPVFSYGLGLFITSGYLYGVGANNNSRTISVAAPPTGQWVTLALVTNTTSGKLFIDKQLAASGDLSGAMSSYPFTLGCGGANAYSNTAPATLDGMVGPTLVFGRALSDAEIATLSDNPYQLLRPANDRLWLDVIAGGGATAYPSGVEATAAVGTAPATGAANAAPSGVTGTAELGTVSATGGAGANANPTGVSASAAIGTLTAAGAAEVSVVGVETTAAVGSVSASGGSGTVYATPSGVFGSAVVGTPNALGAASTSPTGVVAAGAIGATQCSGAADVVPTGVSATTALGSTTATSATVASPTGVAVNTTVGTAGAAGAAEVLVSGAYATAAVGTPTMPVAAAANPVGVLAAMAVGYAAATTRTVGVRGQSIGQVRAVIGSQTGVSAARNARWWQTRQ